jgi:hypothetical protein
MEGVIVDDVEAQIVTVEADIVVFVVQARFGVGQYDVIFRTVIVRHQSCADRSISRPIALRLVAASGCCDREHR